jgi:hypothetical protein
MLGVTPKLSDFGLTKILLDSDHAINVEGAGTVTHLAPGELCVQSGMDCQLCRADCHWFWEARLFLQTRLLQPFASPHSIFLTKPLITSPFQRCSWPAAR